MKFKVENVEYTLRKPTYNDRQLARFEYTKTWSNVLKNGGFTQANIYEAARDLGLWDDDKEEKQDKLIKESEKIQEKEKISPKQQKRLTEINNELLMLRAPILTLYQMSAESQASQVEADFLMSRRIYCGAQPYSRTIDDYYNKLDDGDQVLIEAIEVDKKQIEQNNKKVDEQRQKKIDEMNKAAEALLDQDSSSDENQEIGE